MSRGTLVVEEKRKTLRFGGMSPVVLRELSGVYQPFVKAVKELISNAYDADADKVHLDFVDDYKNITIEDNGCGMDPIEFVRDYIRIGKSFRKDEYTTVKKRPRIGGKGIGFLAPARYCDSIEITTKKKTISVDKIVVETKGNKKIDTSGYFLNGHGDHNMLNFITLLKVTNEAGDDIVKEINGFEITIKEETEFVHVWYEFDATSFKLISTINFHTLFSLDSSKSLENIDNFCEIELQKVDGNEKEQSINSSHFNTKLLFCMPGC